MVPLSARGLRLPVCALIAVLASLAHAQAPGASTQAAPTLLVKGLGRATVNLNGPWQFHEGDNLGWAQPGFDDSAWEHIGVDRGWGAQGHYAYTGFAWYRRHIDFAPVAGAPQNLALLVPPTGGPYEVYWNGHLIGRSGKLPPHPAWRLRPPSQSFGLGPERSGVLAFRMWVAPLGFAASGTGGGLTSPPEAGSPDAIAIQLGSLDHLWLRDSQYYFDENLLYALLGLVGMWAWLRNRRHKLLLWVSLFALMQPAHVLLYNAHLPLPFPFAAGFNWVTETLASVALWYLLLYLLELDGNAPLRRWTRYLALFAMAGALGDWLVVSLDWSSPHAHIYQILDAVLTYPLTLADAYPLVLIAFALRKRLSAASWLVAIAASVYELIGVISVSAIQGLRFTHWHTVWDILKAHLFVLNGNYFDPANIASAFLLISIGYAVYRYSVEQGERRADLEQEFRNARELQHVLIPDRLPEIPGFALSSAYRPAREVGGDFFQILPVDPGSTLIVLGDVSGKGLKAAMAVSLIVGALRALADEHSAPADLLAQLNRRLAGRLQGGFATCAVLHIAFDGRCTLASAGHPAPLLNGRELALPGALPLGIATAAQYAEIEFALTPGDHLALYTDGLLEARSLSGELYGFDRLGALFAARPSAAQAAEAAIDFGQDDDITVLTVERVGTGNPTSLFAAAAAL